MAVHIEVDPGTRNLARQIGKDAGPVLNLDDDDFPFVADGELRDCERVLHGFRMRDEDV
jgi:hypothetical protein